MDFEMSSAGRLYVALHRLREAGFSDASKADPRPGDPLHVLSVTIEESTQDAVISIVLKADAEAKLLTPNA
jgi:hypothetical protein